MEIFWHSLIQIKVNVVSLYTYVSVKQDRWMKMSNHPTLHYYRSSQSHQQILNIDFHLMLYWYITDSQGDRGYRVYWLYNGGHNHAFWSGWSWSFVFVLYRLNHGGFLPHVYLSFVCVCRPSWVLATWGRIIYVVILFLRTHKQIFKDCFFWRQKVLNQNKNKAFIWNHWTIYKI